jgi:uncharacterized protein YsxB (DUF464 family)
MTEVEESKKLEELVAETIERRNAVARNQSVDLWLKGIIGAVCALISALLIMVIGRAGAIVEAQHDFSKKQSLFEMRLDSMEHSMSNNQANIKEQILGVERTLSEYRRDQDSLRDKVTELTVEMRTRRQSIEAK